MSIIKKAGLTSAQSAQKIAQGIKNESREVLNAAKDQAGLPRSGEKPLNNEIEDKPQVLETIIQTGPEIDKAEIERQEKLLLLDLENQLARLRQKREEDLTTYKETQQAAMDRTKAPLQEEAPKAQGKIRKVLGKVKKAVTDIISSRKQGESKQGSGKG